MANLDPLRSKSKDWFGITESWLDDGLMAPNIWHVGGADLLSADSTRVLIFFLLTWLLYSAFQLSILSVDKWRWLILMMMMLVCFFSRMTQYVFSLLSFWLKLTMNLSLLICFEVTKDGGFVLFLRTCFNNRCPCISGASSLLAVHHRAHGKTRKKWNPGL